MIACHLDNGGDFSLYGNAEGEQISYGYEKVTKNRPVDGRFFVTFMWSIFLFPHLAFTCPLFP